MTFSIKSAPGAGDLKNERVVLQAVGDSDIGRYALIHGTIAGDSEIESGPVSAYWFSDKKIKDGEFVVLYTKGGQEKEKILDNGAVTHFFYWGLTVPQWVAGTVPVLVETPTWKTGPKFK